MRGVEAALWGTFSSNCSLEIAFVECFFFFENQATTEKCQASLILVTRGVAEQMKLVSRSLLRG